MTTWHIPLSEYRVAFQLTAQGTDRILYEASDMVTIQDVADLLWGPRSHPR